MVGDEVLTVEAPSAASATLRLDAEVRAHRDLTVREARYEALIDGARVESGVARLELQARAGEALPISLRQRVGWRRGEEGSSAGPTALVALRGTLVVVTAGKTLELPFARSRETRLPRAPQVRVRVDAGRYAAEGTVRALVTLAVENPNAFGLRVSGLSYRARLGDAVLQEGTLGAGERLAPSSSRSFDLNVEVTEREGRARGLEVEGELTAETFRVPFRYVH